MKDSDSLGSDQTVRAQSLSTQVDLAPVVESASSAAVSELFQKQDQQAVSNLYQHTNKSVVLSVEQVEIAALYQSSSAGTTPVNQTGTSNHAENPLPDLQSRLPAAMQPTPEVRRLDNQDNVRLFENLSLQQKQHIPSMNYSQHNYLGNSASSVVINGELMRVGSRIGQNLVIQDIVEDGLILDMSGVRIGVRALSSWINM